jgi:hypothetical protein
VNTSTDLSNYTHSPRVLLFASPVFSLLWLFLTQHSCNCLVQLRLEGNTLDWFAAVIITRRMMGKLPLIL